jgi:hypothetical protein
MQKRPRHVLGASALMALAFALLLSVSLQPVRASTTTSCNGPCWSSIGAPLYSQRGSYNLIEINYTNLSSVNMTGVVYAVVHNMMGQTVEISTGTLQLAAGANGTAYAVVFGLPGGEYSGTLFATTTSGLSLSFPITFSFTVVVVAG